jgi:hypothetical protein
VVDAEAFHQQRTPGIERRLASWIARTSVWRDCHRGAIADRIAQSIRERATVGSIRDCARELAVDYAVVRITPAR